MCEDRCVVFSPMVSRKYLQGGICFMNDILYSLLLCLKLSFCILSYFFPHLPLNSQHTIAAGVQPVRVSALGVDSVPLDRAALSPRCGHLAQAAAQGRGGAQVRGFIYLLMVFTLCLFVLLHCWCGVPSFLPLSQHSVHLLNSLHGLCRRIIFLIVFSFSPFSFYLIARVVATQI